MTGRHAPDGGLERLQGAYYLVSGLWPLLSMRTFQAVTGPKREGWLVRMVGLLAAVIGGTLLTGRRPADRERVVLGGGSAAAFAAVDLWYGGRGRISRVYVLDGLLELAFLAAWALRAGRRGIGYETGASATSQIPGPAGASAIAARSASSAALTSG